MNVLSLNIRGLGNSSKADWVRGLRIHHEVSFMMIQETQFVDLGSIDVGRFWGRGDFCFDWVASHGRSGGLLSLWDPKIFAKTDVIKLSNCLLVSGNIKGCDGANHMLNVYAPHNAVDKRFLWAEISNLIGGGDGLWTVAGDFNAVRRECERRNSFFNTSEANEFNDFIDNSNLHEFSLKGRRFTFVAGDKLSRIDRIFVNWNFFMKWPNAEYVALGRKMSDHSPLVLKTTSRNFGPKPFRFYNSWLRRDDFGDVVKNSICGGGFVGDPDCILMQKFKKLRVNISIWAD
ncbi:uncharacterized protein LOC143552647 [Bidens hawaiensis]|uniref:uncharacterized protein LOC143552647 n=1 Tax=Bidens hawaiensis TaxID=980011 RepID=UPI00404A839A